MQVKCFLQCLLPSPPIIYFSSKCLTINPHLPASVKSSYLRNGTLLDMGFPILLTLQLCFLLLLVLLELVHFYEEINANSYSHTFNNTTQIWEPNCQNCIELWHKHNRSAENGPKLLPTFRTTYFPIIKGKEFNWL